jgi:hypothetical protein
MDYLGRSIVLIKQNMIIQIIIISMTIVLIKQNMIIQIIIISMTMSNKTIGTTISESPVTQSISPIHTLYF